MLFGKMSGPRCIMHIPPKYSTVRIHNGLDPQNAAALLQQFMNQSDIGRCGESPTVNVHPLLNDVLVVEGEGPLGDITPLTMQVYVDRKCGASVSRGADVHAVGVLATSSPLCQRGQLASLWVDIDRKCLRGRNTPYNGCKVFLGNGILNIGRAEVFTVPQNQLRGTEGFRMTHPVYKHPNLPAQIPGVGYPQNLPSIVAVHVLNPQSGDNILDMCSAPGGKAMHIRDKLGPQGMLICLDVSANRIARVVDSFSELGVNNVQCYACDSTKGALDVSLESDAPLFAPPYSPQSFDRILVDAPCSGKGQRPLFVHDTSEKELASFAFQQLKLLNVAQALVKEGGCIVYSTCTDRKQENEYVVTAFLETHSHMKLTSQTPHLADNPKSEKWQRFNPRGHCLRHTESLCPMTLDYDLENSTPALQNLSYDSDTIGFFIAKFIKHHVM